MTYPTTSAFALLKDFTDGRTVGPATARIKFFWYFSQHALVAIGALDRKEEPPRVVCPGAH